MSAKKISARLRREAIELAGCRATFWVAPPACRYPSRRMFSGDAWRLVDAAFASALAARRDGYDGNEDHTHVEAEAQAMLIEGWSP